MPARRWAPRCSCRADAGEPAEPFTTAALGRGWSDDELAAWLRRANVPFTTPDDIADEAAAVLADDGVIAWFDGRSEFGPRALGQRSLMAHPGRAENLERLNDVKGREQFRPGGADGADRPRAADLHRRTDAQPVHAVRAHRASAVARTHSGCRARRRHRPHPDRRRRQRPPRRRAAAGVRAAHRAAGGGQHQPQHRRTAHGRRPPGRARAVRVRAGRRCWSSGRIWSIVGTCSDPGLPDDGRHRPAVRRRGPDRGPPEPDAAARRAGRRAPGRRPRRSWWSTTGPATSSR